MKKKKQDKNKAIINHCVKVFNKNADIGIFEYANHFGRITITRKSYLEEKQRAPMGFAIGDVIEPDEDEEDGEDVAKLSNQQRKLSYRKRKKERKRQ